jgi:hypothetical protein
VRHVRAALRYPPRRLGWYAIDRTCRAAARVAPTRAVARLLKPPGRLVPDAPLLHAWGSGPLAGLLAPRWEPARHGDPRQGVFRLVGRSETTSARPPWSSPGVGPLWDEQLAWLESTWALIASCQGPDVRRWLAPWLSEFQADTSPGQIALRPFPTATRILHGARSLALLYDAGHADDAAAAALLSLLWRDGAWLRWRLEHHNAANHLLRELIALLVWAELFGLRSLATRTRGSIEHALQSQFGPDGAHVEQSAAYHHQVLRDLLELEAVLAAGDRRRPAGLLRTIGAAASFLRWLCVNEDGLVLMGDGDGRPQPPPRALLEATAAAGIDQPEQARELRSDGFALLGLQQGSARLLLRAGALPGATSAHVHADQLAICWSLNGHRIIDGRGTATYHGPRRDETRSAAWHSTVAVPGRLQARFLGPFRLGAHGGGAPIQVEDATLAGRCTDTEGRHLHQRSARMHKRTLVIIDRVQGPNADQAKAFFHFPNATRASHSGPGRASIDSPAGRFLLESAPGSVSVASSTWYPRLGVAAPAQTVVVHLEPTSDGSGAQTRVWAADGETHDP